RAGVEIGAVDVADHRIGTDVEQGRRAALGPGRGVAAKPGRGRGVVDRGDGAAEDDGAGRESGDAAGRAGQAEIGGGGAVDDRAEAVVHQPVGARRLGAVIV